MEKKLFYLFLILNFSSDYLYAKPKNPKPKVTKNNVEIIPSEQSIIMDLPKNLPPGVARITANVFPTMKLIGKRPKGDVNIKFKDLQFYKTNEGENALNPLLESVNIVIPSQYFPIHQDDTIINYNSHDLPVQIKYSPSVLAENAFAYLTIDGKNASKIFFIYRDSLYKPNAPSTVQPPVLNQPTLTATQSMATTFNVEHKDINKKYFQLVSTNDVIEAILGAKIAPKQLYPLSLKFKIIDWPDISPDTIRLTFKTLSENTTIKAHLTKSYFIIKREMLSGKNVGDTIAIVIYIEGEGISTLPTPEFFSVNIPGDPAYDLITFKNNTKPPVNNKITLKSGIQFIAPFSDKSKNPQVDYVELTFRLSGSFDENNNSIRLVLDTNGLTNHPVIDDPLIIISAQNWKIASAVQNHGIYKVSIPIETRTLIDTALKGNEVGAIKIIGQNDDSVRLWLSNRIVMNKPFWFELGSNFDLTNGLQPNNLYAGIFMHKKDVTRFSLRKPEKRKSNSPNFALFGGAYESKSSSSNLSSDSGLVYRSGASYINRPGFGYPIFRDTGTVSITTTVYSLGLFFSPQIRLTNGPAESNGLHIFASLWAEMLWQKTQQVYDYSKLGGPVDTAHLRYVSSIDSINKFNAKQSVISNSDYRSHYLGLGMPIYLKENGAFFYLNPVFGFTTQKFIIQDNLEEKINDSKITEFSGTSTVLSRKWNPFYLLQFRLNDEHSGLAVTGEIRGMFINNAKPFISIAISKKFDLSALAKFVFANF